jgi:hypothetical protein
VRSTCLSLPAGCEIATYLKNALDRLRSFPVVFREFRRTNRPMWLPLSFYLYLDPDHPWWKLFEFAWPHWLNPLPHWNRYQWFRLLFQTILGFATIPAFIIPLTVAGETINVTYAGVSYAVLMSLSNATNMFEGVVGAGLYNLFTRAPLSGIVEAFEKSFLNIAHTPDERTLILQMFVYISLFFTLLTIPFIELLRRELARRKVEINLGRRH